MTEHRWAVVPAGGKGLRYGTRLPKQYLHIAGATILDQVLKTLLESGLFRGIVVPVSDDDSQFSTISSASHPIVHKTCGGKERSDSVRLGLKMLRDRGAEDRDWIFVHDAVRPLITRKELFCLQNATKLVSCPGLVLGVPCADTLKRVNKDLPTIQLSDHDYECTAETLDRSNLWHAMTPQVYRLGDLILALDEVHMQSQIVSDESQAMERIGVKSWLVRGSRTNIKLTYPEDLELIESILQSRRNL